MSAIRISLPGDLWGGLASMLVALPAAIAFGVLVYSSIDPALAGQGALFGMLGAAALGLAAPLFGGTAGLISAPCAPAAAVLAGFAAELVAAEVPVARIPVLLALTGLMAGGLQVVYGLAGGGRFIKYIPYPVVSGYLSGVGLIIALAQIPRLFGFHGSAGLGAGLLSPQLWQWPGLIVGTLTIAATLAAPKLTSKVPAAILGLTAGCVGYAAAAWWLPELRSVADNPLVIGEVRTEASFLASIRTQVAALADIGMEDVRRAAYAALALSALLSIDTLKTCVVLDALTRGRHHSNRELFGQGVANLVANLTGGMSGAGTMGPTLVNVTSGGMTRFSGLLEGTWSILAIVLLGGLIAWVPIAALAGILLVVAFRMFDWNAFRLALYPETRFDFAVIVAVVVVAESVGLIAASATGVGLAILLFIRAQIRGSVLRRRTSLRELSSKTRRLAAEREALDAHGELGACLELQDDLFFGTTDQLFTRVEEDLRKRRWLLLDMRRVQSMDYTAANLFRQMHNRLAEHQGALLFCGMPSTLQQRQDIYRYLRRVGLVGDPQRSGMRVFETRDEALEWIEDRILESTGTTHADTRGALDLSEVELFADMDAAAIEQLRACVHARRFSSGEYVFRRGDDGDDLFLIRSGSVRILLPLAGGKRHHLTTFGRGDYFGEMAFVDRGTRSADAEAKSDCEVYVLSRQEFDAYIERHAVLGARVFSRLARAVSLRLRQTDLELRTLEDR